MGVQVLAREPDARLLLCAPGNFSADLLASALCAAGIGADQMLRFVDPRWPAERVSWLHCDCMAECYCKQSVDVNEAMRVIATCVRMWLITIAWHRQ